MDTNYKNTKDEGGGLAEKFKLMPTAQLKELGDLVSKELDRRNAKDDLGSMSNDAFQKYMDTQLKSKSKPQDKTK